MTIAEILSKSRETEKEVLYEHALLLGLSKISRYSAECDHFKAKYMQEFDAFKQMLKIWWKKRIFLAKMIF